MNKVIEPDGTVRTTGTFAGNEIEVYKEGVRLSSQTVMPKIYYGRVPNQEYHTFRHVVDEGLDPAYVKSVIDTDFQTKFIQVVKGKPFNQIININGIQLKYTAFEIEPNTFNIGRIHAVKIK